MNKIHKLQRLLTAPKRRLPDFIVVGAQRSGTTSLFHYISQHPDIIPSLTKEIHFFDMYYKRGLLWYRMHFPPAHDMPQSSITGESTPYYLFHPQVPHRMRKHLPNVKIIMILRNPTERAISHYFHEVQRGCESLPLMEALYSEESRLEVPLKKMHTKKNLNSRDHQTYSYKSRGRYIEQIQRFDRLFGKRQRLIICSERLSEEPLLIMQRVFEFLEVDKNSGGPDQQRWNVRAHNQRVAPEVYTFLDEYFAPYNKKLFDYIGQDFGWPIQ
jgi:hypothetical protein